MLQAKNLTFFFSKQLQVIEPVDISLSEVVDMYRYKFCSLKIQ